jgi:hypothetical protein
MGKTKIVYWGIFDDYAKNSLFDLELKSLIKDFSESQKNFKDQNYVACPAFREKHKNTFMSYIPYDLLFKNKNGIEYSNRSEITTRTGLYDNSYAFNLNLLRIFYSEEPQMLETSPAFLHKTSYSSMGHQASGAFDIGKWLRPSAPTFQLWPGVTEFSAIEGEPHMYFNFPNEQKIHLKQFYVSDKIKELSESNVSFKSYLPKQNLNSLYSRFLKSNQKNIIIEEIKKNLF